MLHLSWPTAIVAGCFDRYLVLFNTLLGINRDVPVLAPHNWQPMILVV